MYGNYERGYHCSLHCRLATFPSYMIRIITAMYLVINNP
jgi:hypothetical protein